MTPYIQYLQASIFDHFDNALLLAVVYSVMLAEVRQIINLEDLSDRTWVKFILFMTSYVISMVVALILIIILVSILWVISLFV